MSNIIAIVGRPNVGKSTLFNRLTESNSAIVDSVAGVTRDRHYGKMEWCGKAFTVVDTGGYINGSDDIFEEEIRKQVSLALEEADLVLFLVDNREGITPWDDDVADLLRRNSKPVLLVVNKVDVNTQLPAASTFYTLGLGEIYPISSSNGSGTGELLDEINAIFTNAEDVLPLEEQEDFGIPRIAIIGRPNVGKSSFINELIGQKRNVVTPLAGTTRDSTDVRFTQFGHDFILVDTAGIRKKSKVHEDLEFYSVMRSIRAIDKADVCVLMIDAMEGLEAQDVSIFALAADRKKGIVIVVNKWDLVEKDHKTVLEFEKKIKDKIAPFNDIPIIFTSIPKKQRLLKVLEAAMEVNTNRTRRITTSQLNEFFLPIIQNTPPPAIKGKYIRIKYVTQLPIHYPSFAFFCNLPQYVRDDYRRFLENRLRENFNFTGTPLTIFFRQK